MIVVVTCAGLIVVIAMPIQGTRMVFQLVLELTATNPQFLTAQACLTSGTRIRGLSGRAKLFNQPPSEGVILLRFRF